MAEMHSAPVKVEMVGTVTTPEEIEQIREAAALRDDLPDGFWKLPVPERKRILGLTGPQEKEK